MINPNYNNKFKDDNFLKFVDKNSISSLRQFIKSNPDKVELIKKRILTFLQQSAPNLQTNQPENELTLKTWMMLPKEATPSQEKIHQVLRRFSYHLSSETKHELAEILFLPSESWRLNEIKVLGIQLDPTDCKNYFFKEIVKEEPNLEAIKFILETGEINLNEQSPEGNMILHQLLLSSNPDLKLIKLLIQFGADVHQGNHHGNTPLHCATLNPKISSELLKFLMYAGSDVGKENNFGQTPIHTAILIQPPNLEIIQRMIQAKADLNKGDRAGNTPLHYASQAVPSDVDLIELLWMWGGEVDSKNENGATPLHLAAMAKPTNIKLIERLLLYGSDVLAKDQYGNTPLHYALMSFPIAHDVVERLIKNGSDLITMNRFGISCLRLIDFVPTDEQAVKEMVEMMSRKLLANSWGISTGSYRFMDEEVPLAQGFEGEGIGHTGRLLEIFEKHPANQSLDGAFDLYKRSKLNGRESPRAFLKRFKLGEPLSVTTGFVGHEFEIAFFKNYLMISNRGAERELSSVHVYKIDRESSKLSESVIAEIQKGLVSPKKAKQFFYHDLPLLLGHDPNAEPDFITSFFNWEEHQKPQKMGNCWWVNQKAGIFAMTAMQAIEIFENSIPDELDTNEKHRLCREYVDEAEKLYKKFSEFCRIQILKEYMTNSTYPFRDHKLVGKVIKKLDIKKWHYIEEYFNPNELNQLIVQYQNYYRLNSHFQPLLY